MTPIAGGSDRREDIAAYPLKSVEDLLISVLGKWCSRCKRVTNPYVGEGKSLGYGAYEDAWPCCPGCWRLYPDA